MESIDRRLILAGAGLAGVAALTKMAKAGPLNPPPGPIAPTGRTVQEIYEKIARTDVGLAEPRIPVQSLPGSATALHVISEPGSYYLTANIQGVAGKNGIEITSRDVSLNLGGYLLEGVAGSLKGIRVGDFLKRVRIVEGSIARWGDGGVLVGNGAENSVLADLLVGENGGDSGIVATATAILRCRSERNSGWGIRGGSLVVECECYDNSNVGIDANAAIVSKCRVAGNFLGIFCGDQVCISECVARNNVSGIIAFGRARVSSCHVAYNGEGIVAGDGAVVEGNSVVGNSGPGIITPNTGAFVIGNRAQGNSPEYSLSAGNSFGPIVDVAGVGNITSVPNANHPWANFIY